MDLGFPVIHTWSKSISKQFCAALSVIYLLFNSKILTALDRQGPFSPDSYDKA